MTKRLSLCALTMLFSLALSAQVNMLERIRTALEASAKTQVQEKVFIHTDNNAYFIGDTLWYKAYVVRADDLKYTDMSRILYVELLNSDGLLVERQQIIISGDGYSNGNFLFTDSLYSGYYELRAYTRWMLNFNVSEKHHSINDDLLFYNYNMANDFFRSWDGLYSRVFPVYGKPAIDGDYEDRVMMNRPKQVLPDIPKPEIEVSFYPEGGTFLRGVPNRVAFEVVDQYGAAIDIEGVVKHKNEVVAQAKTVHMGRGSFVVTPTDSKMKAYFKWNGKEYDFDLPDAEKRGVAITLSDTHATLSAQGLPQDKEYGVSILCRGSLQHFEQLHFNGDSTITITLPTLPTGVNDITVFSTSGRIYADRLFFVNNHDYDTDTISVSHDPRTTYSPYERVDLDLCYAAADTSLLFSVSVRDAATDGESYDDGDIMTDLLLSSELKGFVANPAYYFEKDDKEHADALDLLMMVQGWRKYDWVTLAHPAGAKLRYQPETTMILEGGVYEMHSLDEVMPEDMASLTGVSSGETGTDSDLDDFEPFDEWAEPAESDGLYSTDDIEIPSGAVRSSTSDDSYYEEDLKRGPLDEEVYVEAEAYMGYGFVGATQLTRDGGRYIFEVPPFYGRTILRMTAYTPKDSLKMHMGSRKDTKAFIEGETPAFYVKRDLFYPVFASEYNYYQTHLPAYIAPEFEEIFSGLSMENDVHELRNVTIKGRSRRARREIDYSKPVYVRDMYDLYNDITDYGLSRGVYNIGSIPEAVARFLYGNMNRYDYMNVAAEHREYVFFRNFSVADPASEPPLMGRSYVSLHNDLRLSRMEKVRVFTDFELRNYDTPIPQSIYYPDVTIDFVSIPDDGKQPVARDRSIMLPGFNEPSKFYHRDYSQSVPEQPTDYRRTLYWNPNARTDNEGKLTISFYNNSKQTRVLVTAAGITADGKLVRR